MFKKIISFFTLFSFTASLVILPCSEGVAMRRYLFKQYESESLLPLSRRTVPTATPAVSDTASAQENTQPKPAAVRFVTKVSSVLTNASLRTLHTVGIGKRSEDVATPATGAPTDAPAADDDAAVLTTTVADAPTRAADLPSYLTDGEKRVALLVALDPKSFGPLLEENERICRGVAMLTSRAERQKYPFLQGVFLSSEQDKSSPHHPNNKKSNANKKRACCSSAFRNLCVPTETGCPKTYKIHSWIRDQAYKHWLDVCFLGIGLLSIGSTVSAQYDNSIAVVCFASTSAVLQMVIGFVKKAHDRQKEREIKKSKDTYKRVKMVSRELKRNWGAPDFQANDDKEREDDTEDNDPASLNSLIIRTPDGKVDSKLKLRKGTTFIADLKSDGGIFLGKLPPDKNKFRPNSLDDDPTNLSSLIMEKPDEEANITSKLKSKKGVPLITSFGSDVCFFLVAVINFIVVILTFTNEETAAKGLSIASTGLQAIGLYFKTLNDHEHTESQFKRSKKKKRARAINQQFYNQEAV